MDKRKRGLLLMAVGLSLMLAGVGLYILHDREDSLAGQNADILLEELTQDIQYSQPVFDTPEVEEGETPMASRTLSGYDLVGVLRIPSANLELPVLSAWSYPLLNVAPCRYSGSLETGDLIILGHSYKSHFRPLWQMQSGDSVEFTDVNGVTHHFVAAAVDVLREKEIDALASEYPLTLFTCTYDSRHRVVVRCAPADGGEVSTAS